MAVSGWMRLVWTGTTAVKPEVEFDASDEEDDEDGDVGQSMLIQGRLDCLNDSSEGGEPR